MAGDARDGRDDPPHDRGARRRARSRRSERSTIGPDDDAGAVYARAAEIAAELLDDVLAQPSRVRRRSPRTASPTPRRSRPADRELDLDAARAASSSNRVRALSPHIGARATSTGGR